MFFVGSIDGSHDSGIPRISHLHENRVVRVAVHGVFPAGRRYVAPAVVADLTRDAEVRQRQPAEQRDATSLCP